MTGEYFILSPNDNVAIALKDLSEGFAFSEGENQFLLRDAIPRGHKFALRDIGKGQNVVKYGSAIGKTSCAVKKGMHVHVHNMTTNLSGTMVYQYNPRLNTLPKATEQLTFKGFRRFTGEAGIRNELWIVPTVGCVNGQAEQIVNRFRDENRPEHIDQVHVFKHSYGCSQLGDDHINTQKALAQLILHPNAGGVLVLGLGCENNQIGQLKEYIGVYDPDRIKFLVAQEVEDEVEEGLKLVQEIYRHMQRDHREDLPLSMLKVGLKCGGSDGLSGITANPLVGAFSDFLVSHGGSTVLTEVPEMFGAEHLLMERAENREVFEKTVKMINGFKDYYLRHDQPVYENPSPGNKNGGITTLEDKSLGCTQKGGTATVSDVLAYAEPIRKAGLNLLSAPGNDLVAASALGFSGCQLVLFTTGRGTPFGSFIPTMKIATNTSLAVKKQNWIDFNAGTLVEGQRMDQLLPGLIGEILKVAEGKKLKHELSGFSEIAIFKTGITL